MTSAAGPSPDAAVGPGPVFLLPVKSFADAKERLAGVLTSDERRRLARFLAEGVVAAIAPMATTVVCDDREVADWAHALGIDVIWSPGKGLNLAVAAGVAELERAGHRFVTVVHADLPLPGHLTDLPATDGVLVVPDRHRDGTNVLRVPAGSGFRFAYGPGSYRRHCDEAMRLGLEVTLLEDAELAIDVDVPEDLELAGVQARLWGPEGPHRSSTD